MEELRERVHNGAIALSEVATFKNKREMKRVNKLINENSLESDLLAVHLMYKHKANINLNGHKNGKLARLSSSLKGQPYIWHRQEYHKFFNLGFISFAGWLFLFLVSFPLISFVPELALTMNFILIILPTVIVTMMATLWFIDRHEKKLSVKTEVK